MGVESNENVGWSGRISLTDKPYPGGIRLMSMLLYEGE